MLGFFLIIGKQGSGKTLLATKFANDNKHLNIFSNYALYGLKYTPITFNSLIESNKNKIDILKMLDINPDYFNNSLMILDEIHLYLDSLDFMRANNRRLQTFFSQLRKRKILLVATTQYIMNLDIRIRRQCVSVLEMEHLKGGLFKVNTFDIDGYFTKEVSSYKIVLSDYYDKYDTNELIL
jgi:archaellum biogenesis ATPase FlaH